MKYGIEIPTDFMLVGKALMTVEGIGKQIDPDLDVFAEAQPVLLRARAASATRPSASATSCGAASSRCRARATTCRSRCARCSTICAAGRLTLRMTNEIATKNLDRAGRRIFSGLVAAVALRLGRVLLEGRARDARLGLRHARRGRVRDALAPRRPRQAARMKLLLARPDAPRWTKIFERELPHAGQLDSTVRNFQNRGKNEDFIPLKSRALSGSASDARDRRRERLY